MNANTDNFHQQTQMARSLYVHIPFCAAKCHYCAFYSELADKHDTGKLVDALISEMKCCDHLTDIRTVYIGGGSPTALPDEQLIRLTRFIADRFDGIEEFTVEANPAQVNYDSLKQLTEHGVNRLSVGAQSFNTDELKFLGRIHSADDIALAVTAARKANIENVSLDLIFALPGSTVDSFDKSLQAAIDLDVEHISAYALTIEDGTPLKKDIDSGKVNTVDEETDRRMYYHTIDKLKAAGFEQYEISNFAKPAYQCKHNLTYWDNEPFVGIGPAAASWGGVRRTTNVHNIDKYIRAIENDRCPVEETHTPTVMELAGETAVLNLRRISGIDLVEYKSRTGHDAMILFAEQIRRNAELGLLEVTPGNIRLTRKALPIADSVLCDFIL